MINIARKKPVEVEVCQWTGDNKNEIIEFCSNENLYWGRNYPDEFTEEEVENVPWELYIRTLEGGHIATIGDYIIKGVKGEFYPCKPDIFEKTYDIIK